MENKADKYLFDVIIWGIISRDLPKLRKELNNLLKNKK